VAGPLFVVRACGSKPQLEIRYADARTAVTDGSTTVELDDDELIDAVMGRVDETSRDHLVFAAGSQPDQLLLAPGELPQARGAPRSQYEQEGPGQRP
jgi:hypothetical protein